MNYFDCDFFRETETDSDPTFSVTKDCKNTWRLLTWSVPLLSATRRPFTSSSSTTRAVTTDVSRWMAKRSKPLVKSSFPPKIYMVSFAYHWTLEFTPVQLHVYTLKQANVSGIWDNLIYGDDVKERLLRYVFTAMVSKFTLLDLLMWHYTLKGVVQ